MSASRGNLVVKSSIRRGSPGKLPNPGVVAIGYCRWSRIGHEIFGNAFNRQPAFNAPSDYFLEFLPRYLRLGRALAEPANRVTPTKARGHKSLLNQNSALAAMTAGSFMLHGDLSRCSLSFTLNRRLGFASWQAPIFWLRRHVPNLNRAGNPEVCSRSAQ